MSVQTIRQEVMEYVNCLDEDKIQLTLTFIKNLVANRQQQLDSIKAFEELDTMSFTLKKEISQDARKERTASIWKKYESLT